MVLVIFTAIFLPETRDRTLEEIDEMFEARIPARAFKSYVCTGIEQYAAEGVAKGDVILAQAAKEGHVEAAHLEEAEVHHGEKHTV